MSLELSEVNRCPGTCL